MTLDTYLVTMQRTNYLFISKNHNTFKYTLFRNVLIHIALNTRFTILLVRGEKEKMFITKVVLGYIHVIEVTGNWITKVVSSVIGYLNHSKNYYIKYGPYGVGL